MSQNSIYKQVSSHPDRTPLRTRYLFSCLVLVSLVLAWANNEFVMTREVFYAIAGNPQNTVQTDAQYGIVQSMNAWGYAMAPIQTAIRVGFVALIIQMVCLLGSVEITFGKLFRVSAVAFGATLFGSFLQILWVVRQPVTSITRATVGIVPDSLTAWFGAASVSPSLLHLALNRVSITSLLWILLIYWGLRETKRFNIAGAAMVTTATWIITSALHVGTSLVARELVS